MIVKVIALWLALTGGVLSTHLQGLIKRDKEDNGFPVLSRQSRHALSDVRYRWTNGVIPYEFVRGHFNSTEKAEIRKAMALWSEHTCLKFRPATSRDRNKIAFKDGSNCYSLLGMIGGKQYVTLSKQQGCRKMGLYLHELGHAIGLYHEHQLPSRDQHIKVHLGRVYSGTRGEFVKLRPEDVNDYGVPYDITSIMHYGKYAMKAHSDWKTLEAIDRTKNHMIVPVGERSNMSFSDIKVVNLMYHCNDHCASDPSCRSPGFLDQTCKCIEPTYIEYCKNKEERCEMWKANNQCEEAKVFMELNCPLACGYCTPRGGVTPEVKPSEGNCVNEFGDWKCNNWARDGECDINPIFMHYECAKACNTCKVQDTGSTKDNATEGGEGTQTGSGEQDTQTTECINKYGDSKCNSWAKGNQCKTNPGFMLIQCARACQQCKDQGTGSTKDTETEDEEGTQKDGSEEDTQTDVSEEGTQKDGSEEDTQTDVSEEGTQTGGSEEGTQTGGSEEGAQTGGSEEDTHTGGSEEGTQSEQECINKYGDSKCKLWAKINECEINPDFMHYECAKACNTCGIPDRESTEDEETESAEQDIGCVNKYGDLKCIGWARGNQCKTNPGFMLIKCAKACKECNDQGTGSTKDRETKGKQGTQTSSNCVDKTGQCAGWAKMGYCRTNNYTRTNCAKSCGTC